MVDCIDMPCRINARKEERNISRIYGSSPNEPGIRKNENSESLLIGFLIDFREDSAE